MLKIMPPAAVNKVLKNLIFNMCKTKGRIRTRGSGSGSTTKWKMGSGSGSGMASNDPQHWVNACLTVNMGPVHLYE